MILSAQRFGGHFVTEWEWNGGSKADLARLTPQHSAWIAQLPAMVHVGEQLLLHADATFYTHYGHSIAQVNQAFRIVLQSHYAAAWNRLLELFCERRAFADTHGWSGARAAIAQHIWRATDCSWSHAVQRNECSGSRMSVSHWCMQTAYASMSTVECI